MHHLYENVLAFSEAKLTEFMHNKDVSLCCKPFKLLNYYFFVVFRLPTHSHKAYNKGLNKNIRQRN